MNRLTCATLTINSIGLAFGIAGAWLIWRNGLPPTDIEEHSFLLNSSPDPNEIATTKTKHKARSKLGMFFLIIGFGFQFVGNFLAIFQ
jgi:hypothetical protein